MVLPCDVNFQMFSSRADIVQYHLHSEELDSVVASWPDFFGNISALEYDGVAEFLMPDISCFKNAVTSEHHQSVVTPDQDNFLDQTDFKYVLGWEDVIIEDGKVLSL